MTLLAGLDRKALGEALRRLEADGWLLFDFRHINPIAGRIIGETGMNSRRLFAWLPAEGECAAIVHRIELQPFQDFPGRVIPYSRWEELHGGLASLVAGKTVAMEVFPDDAVPYLDRVPHGVVQLITRLGGRVVSSAPLVTAFAARWSRSETDDHLYAAEALAEIARDEVARAVAAAGTGLTECAVQQRVIERIGSRGLVFGHPPIVAFGANAAMPHYEPMPGNDAVLAPGDVVLLDLWAGRRLDTVFADQTWMGFAGSHPPEKVERVWRTVRDARDAAVSLVKSRARAGQPVAGFEADRAARGVIESAGYGEWFVHRTGHSIDRDLHGSGPHLDDFETRDERLLGPGVGFSVEPGIYLTGEFGVRSEVNMYWGPDGPVVTPAFPQEDLIVP
jgi:Xaa-Pro aminopeptidase